MRGHLKQVRPALKKGEFTWRIVLSMGRDPATGKYKQRWVTFTGTRKEAIAKQIELVNEVHKGEYVEPSKMTVQKYLEDWLDTSIKGRKTPYTYVSYSGIIRNHLVPAFGMTLLRRLTAMQVEKYYKESKLQQSTLTVHHAVLTAALNAAVRKKLVRSNEAALVGNKPHKDEHGDVLNNVWTIEEARQCLTHIIANGTPQEAALFALALDTGARRAELLGLQWKDINGNTLRIDRQLLKGGKSAPVFSTPKRGGMRSIDLSDETVKLLQEHKRKQAELKMKNRTVYREYDLVFAQTWEIGSRLGGPLNFTSASTLLADACKAANVKEITMHGLRHTCATMLLAAGVPPHVVQRRLGHKRVEMTLNIYSHVLPSMQQDAAAKLAALLH